MSNENIEQQAGEGEQTLSETQGVPAQLPSQSQSQPTSEMNGDPINNIDNERLFEKLRQHAMLDIIPIMDDTLKSMERVEATLKQAGLINDGVSSTERIWKSFYDPTVVEQLKKDI